MKTTRQKQLRIRTFASLVCCLIPFLIWVLWVSIFNLETNQAKRIAIFKSYFPDFLNGRWTVTLIGLFFCVLAIGLSSTCLHKTNKNWKVVPILILLFSSLLLVLNLFSML